MKGTKTKVEDIGSNNVKDTNTDKKSVSIANTNRDAIITAIEASKRSGVPFLFFSNPGYGKTTDVYQYGKKFGYHVEVLSGDQFSRDEILGYQVNEPGTTHLISKEPEWFSRIMEAENGTLTIPNDETGAKYPKGTPSILFLDEISVAPSDVQGALLQLSKDRCIHGGKFLPKDCIVVSAANYKGNLPGYVNIISPELNRFCLVNLIPGRFNDTASSGEDNIVVLSEFLKCLDDSEIMDGDYPTFNTDYHMTPERKKEVLALISNNIRQLCIDYEYTSDGSKGYIDLRNTNYDGIYDTEMDGVPEVFNILTGRSISNLAKVVIALCEMGVTSTNPIYKKFVDGLVGLGTNNWDDDADAFKNQIKKYLERWYGFVGVILDKYNANNIMNNTAQRTIKHINKFNDANTISGAIRNLICERDSHGSSVYTTQEYSDLKAMIEKKFDIDKMEDTVKNLTDSQNIASFRSDYENILTLVQTMEEDKGANKNDIKELKDIIEYWDFYYTSVYMGITTEQVA